MIHCLLRWWLPTKPLNERLVFLLAEFLENQNSEPFIKQWALAAVCQLQTSHSTCHPSINRSIGQAELDYHLVPSSSIVQESISIAARSLDRRSELVLPPQHPLHTIIPTTCRWLSETTRTERRRLSLHHHQTMSSIPRILAIIKELSWGHRIQTGENCVGHPETSFR